MEAYFADVVLSAHIQDVLACVRLPQYADLVFGRVSLAFHFVWASQTITSPGPKKRSHVTVARNFADTAEFLKQKRQVMLVPEPLKTARATLAGVEAAKRRAEDNVQAIKDGIETIEENLKVLRGENTQANYDEWLRRKFKDERICMQPLSAAIEWDCPLNRGRQLLIEKKKPGIPVQQTREHLEQRKAAESQRLTVASQVLVEATQKVAAANCVVVTETEKFDTARAMLDEASTAWKALANEARRAISDVTEAKRLEESINDLERKIDQSQKRQTLICEKQSAARSQFSNICERVVSAVIREDVTGSIQPRGDSSAQRYNAA